MLKRLWKELLARRSGAGRRAVDANRELAPLAREQVEKAWRAVIMEHGRWTAHNIALGHGLYTMGPGLGEDDAKLQRVVQAVADLAGAPLHALRIADLACLEGMYALEFASHGSRVLAIEGREANIAKARFAKETLGLDGVEFELDDVRNFGRARHGAFDVVLCLGILYHLDAPDVFELLAKIGEACARIAVIDTHVSLVPEESRSYRGNVYWGRTYREHRPGATADEKRKALWASLDNEKSFFLTLESLILAAQAAGFTSVYECRLPIEPGKPDDRVTLIAVKGLKAGLRCVPQGLRDSGGPPSTSDR